MKIKILKNTMALGFGYFAGDEIDVDEKTALFLIDNMHARASKEPQLPEDFPAREILEENDLNSITKIIDFGIENLDQLKGIGKVTEKAIADYIYD